MLKFSLYPTAKCKLMLEITINGQTTSFAEGITVRSLLESRQLADKRVAVECNGEIVPRGRHAETLLQHGDRLEIVVAVGGG